jgi:hypothetical protein
MDEPSTPSIDILNEQAVRDLVMSICLVLNQHGIDQIHVGGLMRLVGIPPEQAAEHDDEVMVITDIQESVSDQGSIVEEAPPGTTLH